MIRRFVGRHTTGLAKTLTISVGASVLTWALVIAPTHAQTPNPCGASPTPGRLSGTVSDAQGGRVRGATVRMQCRSGELTVTTDADGRFTLDIEPGTHQMLVAVEGFEAAAQAVTVSASAPASVDVVLQVASLADTVTVRGAEPAMVRRDQTATRTDTPLIETPQSVTVITSAQIEKQASPNLQETLRYTAGVRHELYGIDNRGDWLSLRGSDQSTVLLNGMRLPLTGYYGVVREEPYAFDQISVVRGPSSIIAGQNDPGGVVNLTSKRSDSATMPTARSVSTPLDH
jgi:outer membrane receptor for monomeric catechols